MIYEKITEKATIRITAMMNMAKASRDRYIAEFYFNAAWGVRLLWLDLCRHMEKNCHGLYDAAKLRGLITRQHAVYDRILDKEDVPQLKYRE